MGPCLVLHEVLHDGSVHVRTGIGDRGLVRLPHAGERCPPSPDVAGRLLLVVPSCCRCPVVAGDPVGQLGLYPRYNVRFWRWA